MRAFSPGEFDHRTIWMAVIFAVVVLEAGVMLVYQGFGEHRTGDVERSALDGRQQETTQAPDSGGHQEDPSGAGTTGAGDSGVRSTLGKPAENAEGGYSFDVPPGWSVERTGTMTEVGSPGGDTVVSLGLGFPGSIQAGTERLVDLLDRSYDDVSLGMTRRTTINDRRTLMAQGSAVNDSGALIDFRLYTIQSDQRNFAIGAFQQAAGSWRSSDVDELARSFRVVAVD